MENEAVTDHNTVGVNGERGFCSVSDPNIVGVNGEHALYCKDIDAQPIQNGAQNSHRIPLTTTTTTRE